MILSEFFHVCWNIRGCWVWILRNGSNSDNSWRTKNLSNWRVQFSWGNNSKGCSTTLLVLMSFDVFREMVTSHKPFRTFWAFKSFFTFLKRKRKPICYWKRALNTAWSSESHPILFNTQSVFIRTPFPSVSFPGVFCSVTGFWPPTPHYWNVFNKYLLCCDHLMRSLNFRTPENFHKLP